MILQVILVTVTKTLRKALKTRELLINSGKGDRRPNRT
jgi:hypothetical protein